MAVKDSVKAIPIAAFNANALLPAAWQAITPAGGLPESCFAIHLRNVSNTSVQVSYDGVNVNDYVLADSDVILYFQSSNQPNNRRSLMRYGTIIYLRGGQQGANGVIYLSGYYQEEQV